MAKVGDREVKILEAYLKCCHASGVDQVTLQMVAEKAGLPYSSVHYYFGGEDKSILASAMAYVASASESFIVESLATTTADMKKNSVHRYVLAKFEWLERFPAYASMFCYFIYQMSRDAKYRKMGEPLLRCSLLRIQNLVIQEIGKGHYKACDDLEERARDCLLIVAGGELAALGESDAKRKVVCRRVLRLVDACLA